MNVKCNLKMSFIKFLTSVDNADATKFVLCSKDEQAGSSCLRDFYTHNFADASLHMYMCVIIFCLDIGAFTLLIVQVCKLFKYLNCSSISIVQVYQLFKYVDCSSMSIVQVYQLFKYVDCSSMSIVQVCQLFISEIRVVLRATEKVYIFSADRKRIAEYIENIYWARSYLYGHLKNSDTFYDCRRILQQ